MADLKQSIIDKAHEVYELTSSVGGDGYLLPSYHGRTAVVATELNYKWQELGMGLLTITSTGKSTAQFPRLIGGFDVLNQEVEFYTAQQAQNVAGAGEIKTTLSAAIAGLCELGTELVIDLEAKLAARTVQQTGLTQPVGAAPDIAAQLEVDGRG